MIENLKNLFSFLTEEQKKQPIVVLELTSELKEILKKFSSNEIEFQAQVYYTFPLLNIPISTNSNQNIFYLNKHNELIIKIYLIKNILLNN